MLRWWWFIALLSAIPDAVRRSSGAGFSETLNDLQMLDSLLRDYDRRMTPTHNTHNATVVECEIFIRSIGSIDPMAMDYEVDLYLSQSWHDERLHHENMTKALDLSDPVLVKRIWKPEVFFANAKSADFQYVTVPNVMVRVNPSGEILYMLRLKLRFACMMDLSKYPLDLQRCTMEMASFSKTTQELQLMWAARRPIKLTDNLKLPQFEIQDIQATQCNASFHIGEYSCIVAEFLLQRAIGFHLVESYLPTILIVVISWVSFWLDIEAIPARVTLGVTTLLTISTKSSGIQANLPQVSYVKAIDVWMGACTTFVFVALLEFTFINYLWRKQPTDSENLNQSHNKLNDDHETDGKEDGETATTEFFPQPAEKKCPDLKQYILRNKMRARYIDHLCRLFFPCLFLLFNILYWPYYLIIT